MEQLLREQKDRRTESEKNEAEQTNEKETKTFAVYLITSGKKEKRDGLKLHPFPSHMIIFPGIFVCFQKHEMTNLD